MLKKLVVPLFSLAIATFGCSSSTTNTGTGGSGGTSATGGAGGHATGGTTGSGGTNTTGGSGGHATGGAGGTTTATGGAGGHATGGAGGQTATGGAGGAVTTDAGRMADCTVTMQDGTSVLDATTFCTNLLAYCSNVSGFTLPTDYATQAACVAAYGGNGTTQKNCQSYHLCWGVEGITNNMGAIPKTHCPHATAMAVCLPPADAASGG